MKDYEDFLAWTVFWKVVKTGSLSKAALSLDMQPAYASRLLTRLEKAVGEPLLERSKRPIVTTVRGAQYYDEVGPTVAEFQRFIARHFEDSTYRDSPYLHTIRTSASQGAAHSYFPKLLARYMSNHPKVSFCLYIEKSPQELLKKRLDILYSPMVYENEGLVRYEVRKVPCLLLCSPSYLREHGEPRTPSDLLGHVGLERIGDLYPSSGHALYRGAERQEFTLGQNLFSESTTSLIESVVQGAGIIFDIPAEQVEEEIASGRLVQILPGWHRRPIAKSVYIRREDSEEPGSRIADFAAWLVGEERKDCFIRETRVFQKLGGSPRDYL